MCTCLCERTDMVIHFVLKVVTDSFWTSRVSYKLLVALEVLLLTSMRNCMCHASASFPITPDRLMTGERSSCSSLESAQKNVETIKSITPSDNNTHCFPPIEGHQTYFVAECVLPTKLGGFRMRSYTHASETQCLEPVVLISGNIADKENVLVRIHDQCFTSEVLGSLRCDCKEQLESSMRLIKRYGGVLIYLQQEGRGIGLPNKIGKMKVYHIVHCLHFPTGFFNV